MLDGSFRTWLLWELNGRGSPSAIMGCCKARKCISNLEVRDFFFLTSSHSILIISLLAHQLQSLLHRDFSNVQIEILCIADKCCSCQKRLLRSHISFKLFMLILLFRINIFVNSLCIQNLTMKTHLINNSFNFIKKKSSNFKEKYYFKQVKNNQ